jgi:hypothetical protein
MSSEPITLHRYLVMCTRERTRKTRDGQPYQAYTCGVYNYEMASLALAGIEPCHNCDDHHEEYSASECAANQLLGEPRDLLNHHE